MTRNYPRIDGVIDLNKVTYDDAIALIKWCVDQTRSYSGWEGKEGRLHIQHAAEQKVKWKRDAEDNEKRKKRQAELDKLVTIWIYGGGLVAGDIVKMKGCRDRQGIRQVLTVDRTGGNVECRQIFPALYQRNKDKVLVCIRKESLGQITNHFTNKIQSVKCGDKFIPIRQIVEDHENKIKRHDAAIIRDTIGICHDEA